MRAPLPGFGVRLRGAIAERGPLCVGVDPHPALLAAWGLPDDPEGLERFSRAAVEAVASSVAAVKPQSAFFERHGARGLAVLERVLADLRAAGTLAVLDAKRGDIGSTAQAYADAYLRDDAPLRADAVTASPYLGVEALQPLLDAARDTGRGVFVLALTSNPEGAAVQQSRDAGGRPVAGLVLDALRVANTAVRDAGGPVGPYGAVVGATVAPLAEHLDLDLEIGGPLLVPGLGAQGGGPDDLARLAARAPAARADLLPASSRDVLAAGPSRPALRDAARRAAETYAAALRS